MEMGDIPCSEALKGEGDGIFLLNMIRRKKCSLLS